MVLFLESINPFNFGNAGHVSNLLELVHNDLFYIDNPSLVGARYDLIFIDDVSHYIFIKFLKNKSHVFEIFKESKALPKKQCG